MLLHDIEEVPYLFNEGAKCGSTYIDANFKRWLRKLVGERYYRILDPKSTRRVNAHSSEGRLMRKIMSQFDVQKRKFSNSVRNNMHIELPEELYDLTVPHQIEEGELIITP